MDAQLFPSLTTALAVALGFFFTWPSLRPWLVERWNGLSAQSARQAALEDVRLRQEARRTDPTVPDAMATVTEEDDAVGASAAANLLAFAARGPARAFGTASLATTARASATRDTATAPPLGAPQRSSREAGDDRSGDAGDDDAAVDAGAGVDDGFVFLSEVQPLIDAVMADARGQQSAVATLITVCTNLVEHPSEPRYRSLKLTTDDGHGGGRDRGGKAGSRPESQPSRFARDVWRRPSQRALLEALGFRETTVAATPLAPATLTAVATTAATTTAAAAACKCAGAVRVCELGAVSPSRLAVLDLVARRLREGRTSALRRPTPPPAPSPTAASPAASPARASAGAGQVLAPSEPTATMGACAPAASAPANAAPPAHATAHAAGAAGLLGRKLRMAEATGTLTCRGLPLGDYVDGAASALATTAAPALAAELAAALAGPLAGRLRALDAASCKLTGALPERLLPPPPIGEGSEGGCSESGGGDGDKDDGGGSGDESSASSKWPSGGAAGGAASPAGLRLRCVWLLRLDLSSNALTSLPACLGAALPRLLRLSLGHNRLGDHRPTAATSGDHGARAEGGVSGGVSGRGPGGGSGGGGGAGDGGCLPSLPLSLVELSLAGNGLREVSA